MSRGLPLPIVSEMKEPPFVVASRNPNGAISVATLPRTDTIEGIRIPRADVTIEIDEHSIPIGIFGDYRSLILKFAKSVRGASVIAQDLAGDHAIVITENVTMHDHEIVISGELIDRVGRMAGRPGDKSTPGLVLLVDVPD